MPLHNSQPFNKNYPAKFLLGAFAALLLNACATSGSDPRVREGQLPEADAFGVVAGEGSYGEERTRMRVARMDQAGTIVQADRDNGNYMVRTRSPLPQTTQILVAEKGVGVLLILTRSTSQQLFSATPLNGQFRLSERIRIPTAAEHAALLDQYAEAIQALTE